MSDFGFEFDASEGDTIRAPGALPRGKYIMIGIEGSKKETSKKDGSYFEIIFEVSDGEHKGRRIWQKFNIENPNPTTVEIAVREFRTFCQAVGRLKVSGFDQVLGLSFWADVGFEKPSKTDLEMNPPPPLKNKITNYHDASTYHLMPDGMVRPASGGASTAAPVKKAWTPTDAPARAAAPAAGKWTPPAPAATPPAAAAPPPDEREAAAPEPETPAAPAPNPAAAGGAVGSWAT